MNKTVKPTGTQEQVEGKVTTDSLSMGKSWIQEIYDAPHRNIRGSFGTRKKED